MHYKLYNAHGVFFFKSEDTAIFIDTNLAQHYILFYIYSQIVESL